MPRGGYRWHEPKKAKKSKQKVAPPSEILPPAAEPQRIPPKRKAAQRVEGDEERQED